MNGLPLGLTGLGFWLAVAVVVITIIWALVKKQQMKHELTLKLLEKGQTLDADLLARLIAPASAGTAAQKSAADLNREGGGFVGLIFVMSGLVIAFVALVHQSGMSWPLLGLGVFTFLFGNYIWRQTIKEYYMRKEAEKDLPRN
jgi:4-hydroxybenzoate polyprenyltransferase